MYMTFNDGYCFILFVDRGIRNGWNYTCYSWIVHLQIHVLKFQPSLCNYKVFEEVSNLNEAVVVYFNPVWLVSLLEKRDHSDVHTQRNDQVRI